MDRFKIALKKESAHRPRHVKERALKKEKDVKRDLNSFLKGPVTIIDSKGNTIVGIIQDLNIENNRPVAVINSLSGPVGMIPGRSEIRLELSLLVDRWDWL